MRLRTNEQEQRIEWSVAKWTRMNFVTATVPEEEHDPKMISMRWTAFIKELKRWHAPDLRCVRILQEHPGGHGWHIHALLDRYIPHQVMLRVAKECGLGRMDFRMVSGEHRQRSIRYMVRYICRDMKNRWKNPLLKGVRLLTASGNLRSAERWWVRLCDITVVDTGILQRRVLQTMLEVRYPEKFRLRTSRGRPLPLRMLALFQMASDQDRRDWLRECEARRAEWNAL